MKQILLFPPRLVALVAILLLAHVIGAAAAGFDAPAPPSAAGDPPALASPDPATPEDSPSPRPTAEPGEGRSPDPAESLALLGLVLGVCLLEALAIAALLLNAHAHAHGWTLVGGLWLAQFGVMTLQPQLEALAFGVIRPEMAFRVAGMGAAMASVVAPLGVLVFWRIRPRTDDPTSSAARPWRSTRSFALLFIAGALYVALYLIFGYFIAWRSPEVREYYGGDAAIGFWPHLRSLHERVPWFLPFQWFRGLVWAALGWMTLSLLRGPWWRAGTILGLFFALMLNAQLLLPNPLMPETVRFVHILETAPCNLAFGFILAWMLRPRHSSAE